MPLLCVHSVCIHVQGTFPSPFSPNPPRQHHVREGRLLPSPGKEGTGISEPQTFTQPFNPLLSCCDLRAPAQVVGCGRGSARYCLSPESLEPVLKEKHYWHLGKMSLMGRKIRSPAGCLASLAQPMRLTSSVLRYNQEHPLHISKHREGGSPQLIAPTRWPEQQILSQTAVVPRSFPSDLTSDILSASMSPPYKMVIITMCTW